MGCNVHIFAESVNYLVQNVVRRVLQGVLSGEESEAIYYTKENLEAWEITPGTLGWLLHQTR